MHKKKMAYFRRFWVKEPPSFRKQNSQKKVCLNKSAKKWYTSNRSMRHESFDMGVNFWGLFSSEWVGVTRASDLRLFRCGLEFFRAA